MSVICAHICEYGHLKGGLKRRQVYRLTFKLGVELCPTLYKQPH
ncbi:hypothetical protein CRENPOLYSF2_3780011 [Crenothrix polyspora]|uniref:Transposase n=1 Tax=Crenothrix polyspora TaxID=360316 RepID=A0A1R4HDP1_9GAMM|nr:hypothetical protein CRENPOLYSF2_3780011 [Crenothrix polyspora]